MGGRRAEARRPRGRVSPAAASRIVVPAPGALSTPTSPPWPSTIAFTTVRPSPAPATDRSSRVRRPGEALEDALLVLGGIPGPSSATSTTACSPRSDDGDLDVAALAGELHGVGDEVVEDLCAAVAVAEERADGLGVEHERRPWPLGLGPGGLDRVGRDRAEVDLRARELEPPASAWATNSRSPTRRSIRRALRSTTSRKRRTSGESGSRAVEHEVDVADDRRQRRAQLVRDEREHLVLQPLGLALRGDVAQHDDPPRVGVRRRSPAARSSAPGAGRCRRRRARRGAPRTGRRRTSRTGTPSASSVAHRLVLHEHLAGRGRAARSRPASRRARRARGAPRAASPRRPAGGRTRRRRRRRAAAARSPLRLRPVRRAEAAERRDGEHGVPSRSGTWISRATRVGPGQALHLHRRRRRAPR